jgi:hypothetical protein
MSCTARPVVVSLILALAAGCGGPRVATVEGVVTLGGRPLADVEVQFIPDPAQGTTGPPASAYTDKDGRYRIEAAGHAGVVVGKHRVCVNDATLMMPGGGVADPESGVPGAGPKAAPRRSRVPAAYSDATRTPFAAVEVKPGTQTMDFALNPNP